MISILFLQISQTKIIPQVLEVSPPTSKVDVLSIRQVWFIKELTITRKDSKPQKKRANTENTLKRNICQKNNPPARS